MGLSAVVAYHGGNVKEKRKWSNIHCDDFTLTPDDDPLERRGRDVRREAAGRGARSSGSEVAPAA